MHIYIIYYTRSMFYLPPPSLFSHTLIFRHPLIIQNVALTPPSPLKKGGGVFFFSPVEQRASHWTKSKFNMFDQYLKNHRLGLKSWYPIRSGWPLFILRSQGQGLCRFVIDWLIKCFPIDSNWQDEHLHQIRFNGTIYGDVNHCYYFSRKANGKITVHQLLSTYTLRIIMHLGLQETQT